MASGSNRSCGGATICNAAAGYDGPSGIGSPTGLGAFSVIGSPESTALPTVSGTAELHHELKVESHAVWTGSPTVINDQWADCDGSGTFCAPIPGATASYTLMRADLRHTVRVQETASNASGTSTPTVSAATEVVHRH